MYLNGFVMKQVRTHLDLSQSEMAERMRVSLVSYQRWESDKVVPRPYYRRLFRTEFEGTLIEMKIYTSDGTRQATISSTSVDMPRDSEERNELQEFMGSDLTTRLLSFAFSQYENNQILRAGIVKILKEFDAMNTNANDQVSRREALKRIAVESTRPTPFVLCVPRRVTLRVQTGAEIHS